MYDTLEEAQARILELNDQVTMLTGERDTLSQENENLRRENEETRSLNQKYFNKLIAQEKDTHENNQGDEGEEVPSCEEFAQTLSI